MLFVSFAASGEELLDDSDADSHYQANLAELSDSDAISEVSGDDSSDEPQSDHEQELARVMEQNEDHNVVQRQQELPVQPAPQPRRQRGMIYYIIFCLLIFAVDISHFRTVHS